jgi:hypothetical protein
VLRLIYRRRCLCSPLPACAVPLLDLFMIFFHELCVIQLAVVIVPHGARSASAEFSLCVSALCV